MSEWKVSWDELKNYLLRPQCIKEFRKRLEEGEGGSYTRADAERIMESVLEHLKSRKVNNLWIVENKFIPNAEKKKPTSAIALKFLVEKVREADTDFGFIDTPLDESQLTEEQKLEIIKSSETISGVIGRIAIVRDSPATPYSFSFWLERDSSKEIEIGDFVVVELSGNFRAIAVVDNIEAYSDISNVIDHHFLWGFGNPEEKIPTKIPVIRIGRANLVYRSDGKNTPFTDHFPITKAKKDILESVFSELIKEDQKVILGFVKDGDGLFVPVYGDFSYIFGYQGGHLNITGKSGIAGKTSYALFFITSSLSFAEKMGKSLAFIAFNVKERDLLDLDRIPYKDLDEAFRDLRTKGLEESADMWEKAKEYVIDPLERFKETMVYIPEHVPHVGETAGKCKSYSYGLQDIFERGIHVFLSLFEKDDINEQFESLVYSLFDEFGIGSGYSFYDMFNELQTRLASSSSRSSGFSRVLVGGVPHYPATVQKMINRLNKIISSPSVLEIYKPKGNPIKIDDLRDYDFWVIDIRLLKDNEKRMVFYSILTDLQIFLEAKKEGKLTVNKGDRVFNITNFPRHVCVFIDELNKFAPAGARTSSPIKQFIIEIAARGRSIGLSLLGAEQFASSIDEEVLGNTSTYLIGKSEEFELSHSFYRRLPEGLRRRIPYLKKGELVLVHEMLTTPLIINFPIPLNRVEQ